MNNFLVLLKINFQRSEIEVIYVTVKNQQAKKPENSYFYLIFDASKNQYRPLKSSSKEWRNLRASSQALHYTCGYYNV